MDSLPEQVYFKDLQGRFLCVNRAQARFLGLESSEDALGRSDHDFFEPELATIKDLDEREIIRSGRGFVDKEELSTGIGGAVRWTLSSKLPFFDNDGRIVGTFGISRDISEMREARDALQAHHRLVSTLIEILPCRIFVKDHGGRLRLANEAYRQALGVGRIEDIIGRRLSEVVGGQRARRYAEDDRKVLEEGISILNREDFDASPLGDKRWLLLSKVPLLDAAGSVEGIVGMAADITEQKKAEADAVTARRELEEKNKQIETELALAGELQNELMASSVERVREGIDPLAPFRPRIGAVYFPSAHLAGDFFQLFPLPGGCFSVLMCDVMGHGVRAALVTTLIRGLLANLKLDPAEPGAVLGALNERLCALLDQPALPRFVTAVYGIVDVFAGRVTLSSAGHPWPLHQRGVNASVANPRPECGPALGLVRGAVFPSFGHELVSGDRLLLYTDGWAEETNPAGEEFGVGRLAEVLAACREDHPDAALAEITAALRAFSGSMRHRDDLCAVLVAF